MTYTDKERDDILAQCKRLLAMEFTAQQDDGWIPYDFPWVYASASSFTILGVDATDIFKPRTRIKYNDGSQDYGIVASSTFSTNTTVNLIPNATFAIANTTLFDCYYSYANPPDFIYWYNWTPTVTGGGAMTIASVVIALARYNVSGGVFSFEVNLTCTTGGTASTDINIVLPTNVTTVSSNVPCTLVYVDGGSQTVGFGLFNVPGTVVVCRKSGMGNWGLGAGRQLIVSGFCQI